MNAHMDTSELRMLLPQDKKNRDIKGEGYDIPLVLLALFARPSSGAAVASEKLQRSVSVFWRCLYFGGVQVKKWLLLVSVYIFFLQ